MYSKSEQILRFIHDHGPVQAHIIWEHFGMDSYKETDQHLHHLRNKKVLRYQSNGNIPYGIYSLLPAGRAQLEELEKEAAQEKENARLISEIAEMRKSLKELKEIRERLKELEELRELRDMTESIKTQTNIALEKATKADWKSWIALIVSVATFVVYLFEVFG